MRITSKYQFVFLSLNKDDFKLEIIVLCTAMPEFEDNSILGEDIYHAVQFEGRQNTSGMYTMTSKLYSLRVVRILQVCTL